MADLSTTDRISGLKAQAKRLRAQLTESGTPVSHSQSLELIAQQHGARDWNTLHALALRPGNARPLVIGDRVSGRYLGQDFTGHVYGLSHFGPDGGMRITVHFDAPVDVVTFDSFSSYRQRVSGVINAEGRSPQKTSNGEPQLVVVPTGF